MPAVYAADPARSRGRRFALGPRASVGPRDEFQRDRDRVIHSISFRRLRHKTQVFVAPDEDHLRVRLTHSLEVAQIGRTVARALDLNEDLTEALCLAHDLGHPPFGHAGEAALKRAMAQVGGFDHNGHTVRILSELEEAYPHHLGLNLSWEVLEGLAKHNGPVRHPGWALAAADAAWPLALDTQPSLEAQVAAIADDIAYDNHDIDDGLRAGLLDLDQLRSQPLVATAWDAAAARWPEATPQRLTRELVREGIGQMVLDLLAESRRRLAEVAPQDVEAVRAHATPLIGFSPAMAAGERALKRFMYRNLYHHPRQLAVAAVADRVVAALAQAYLADPALLPPARAAALPADEPGRTRAVGDFIAGMTDRFALARYRELIGPIDLPAS